jgi:hypothetical protein
VNNKLSELKAAALAATPGPWMKIDYFWIGHAGAINSEFITCDNGPDAEYIKRVSPDAVLALLAELEASKTNAEYYKSAFEEQRDHADILEKRLATPVRLPEPCVYEVNGTRFYDQLSEVEVIALLREQGFTVEGDE